MYGCSKQQASEAANGGVLGVIARVSRKNVPGYCLRLHRKPDVTLEIPAGLRYVTMWVAYR